METVRKLSVPMKKKSAVNLPEEFELQYGDGFVQNRDSMMTRVSDTEPVLLLSRNFCTHLSKA